ncbi:esterase-like activity of phytase family protein [Chitinophaga nivalis]|uniref:Esterase-like activity of phytase family protein n=1 Tax=Chitinophaga nivalis TaxID=2991709 RepID=A0ABT3IKM3_9BACT|nr:esterase-like activity of phytase family protein [Chitinophaga nivalis]MCW3465797.1 esterase-like activity of phytase family protein [Chitinophaga nivalis]MCW3484512.1 esterase-like activity of phytase family protein [Chitinophaga nivalis]
MKTLRYLAPLGFLLLAACHKDDDNPSTPPEQGYPTYARLAGATVLTTSNTGVKVYNGGYGSSITTVPGEPGYFYLMTDRGPNVDGIQKDSKIFPVPAFNPQIGKFRLSGDSMILVETIRMKSAANVPVTGLPNPIGAGGTGEIALDKDGNVLATDIEGIDSEGLAAGADGTFWISDEYGPHLLHLDRSGKTLERINPYGTGTGGRKIPQVFAKRRANRGMEGIAITPDGKTLVGIMQSPLYNPSKDDVKNSLYTRILTYDIASGKSKQYLYKLENKNTANSEITAISNNTFLVLERDGEFPGDPAKPSLIKRIYKIDLNTGTDVSDPADGAAGKLVNNKTLEVLSEQELQTAGIHTVGKSLVVDLLKDVAGYPHDKPEGIVLINSSLLAVSNDDDFGIVPPDPVNNTYIQKILPLIGKTDFNTVYFIKLATPLF